MDPAALDQETNGLVRKSGWFARKLKRPIKDSKGQK